MSQDLGVGSHFPILAAAIARTTGDILECGTGWWSTPLIHALANGNRKVRSIDSDESWLEKFIPLYRCDFHTFESLMASGHHPQIEAWEMLGESLPEYPDGVCFLDQSPGEARVPMAKAIKGKFKFLVAHDVDADIPPGGGNYGWKQLDGFFKYHYIFKDLRPWTAVYSDIEMFSI